jgi:hypothetical protein
MNHSHAGNDVAASLSANRDRAWHCAMCAASGPKNNLRRPSADLRVSGRRADEMLVFANLNEIGSYPGTAGG